ncbi:hypothetical protein [Rhodococcoides fascians]|nr:hypothetical protein [Rhodococcus fascians]
MQRSRSLSSATDTAISAFVALAVLFLAYRVTVAVCRLVLVLGWYVS